MPIELQRKFYRLSVLALLAIPVCAPVAQCKSKHLKTDDGQSAVSSSLSDEQAIRNQADHYSRAFAAGDAAALANMWSTDGTFVDANGQEYKGRAAIEAMFVKLFKEIGKEPLSISIDSIRFPAPSVAIEEGTTQVAVGIGTGGTGRYIATHVKRDGVWFMDAVSETTLRGPAETGPPRSKLQDLSWMLGKWTATGGGETIHLHAQWMPNHNQTFIKCNFNSEGTSSSEELQIFGWNPRTRQINAWNYASNGGFGYGRMAQTDGTTWVEQASSMQPDGTVCSATYKFKRLGNDSFTWQSLRRSRGGQHLPDTLEITVQRDSNERGK